MNDELDAMDDTSLSWVFCEEVAGLPVIKGSCVHETPTFATNSQAVMPWLKNGTYAFIWNSPSEGAPGGTYNMDYWPGKHGRASATTFARAACICLIRSTRAAKTP